MLARWFRFGLVQALMAGRASSQQPWHCDCGANPPGVPQRRTLEPYAGAPEDMRPFSRFAKPYHEHYTKIVEYNGAARDVPTVPAQAVAEVPIGFLGPIYQHKDEKLGRMMLDATAQDPPRNTL